MTERYDGLRPVTVTVQICNRDAYEADDDDCGARDGLKPNGGRNDDGRGENRRSGCDEHRVSSRDGTSVVSGTQRTDNPKAE